MRKIALQIGSVLLFLGLIVFIIQGQQVIAPQQTDDNSVTTSSSSEVVIVTSTTTEPATTTEITPAPKPAIPTPTPVIPPPTLKPGISPTGSPFGHPERFTIGGKKFFVDGLTVTLKSITDSRCPVDTECIWSGEINSTFTLSGGTLTSSTDINLGSVRTRAAAVGNYTITLATSTATTTTVIITSTATAPALGQISGTVVVSPLCPVESIDNSCSIPPGTYSSRNVIVYKNDMKTVYTKQQLQPDGTFTVRLEAGNYGVQISPAGISAGEIKAVTVSAYKSTAINFDIDSGIR